MKIMSSGTAGRVVGKTKCQFVKWVLRKFLKLSLGFNISGERFTELEPGHGRLLVHGKV